MGACATGLKTDHKLAPARVNVYTTYIMPPYVDVESGYVQPQPVRHLVLVGVLPCRDPIAGGFSPCPRPTQSGANSCCILDPAPTSRNACMFQSRPVSCANPYGCLAAIP